MNLTGYCRGFVNDPHGLAPWVDKLVGVFRQLRLTYHNRYEKQELNHITQGEPIAGPIGHLTLKSTANN